MTCDSSPCLNGGTCQNTDSGTYNCTCPFPYMGVQCEETIPNPTEIPCAPGYYGTDCSIYCVPDNSCTGHYTCDPDGIRMCYPMWKGPDCNDYDIAPDNPINFECDGNTATRCKHGGTCFNKTCCCMPGYTGEDCESEIDECDSNPCQNGGTCNDYHTYYTCMCLDGKIILYIA